MQLKTRLSQGLSTLKGGLEQHLLPQRSHGIFTWSIPCPRLNNASWAHLALLQYSVPNHLFSNNTPLDQAILVTFTFCSPLQWTSTTLPMTSAPLGHAGWEQGSQIHTPLEIPVELLGIMGPPPKNPSVSISTQLCWDKGEAAPLNSFSTGVCVNYSHLIFWRVFFFSF